MRTIRLISQQIPDYWELIKWAVTEVNEIPEKDRPLYFNQLIHALLNDKAQCYVRVNDDREIVAILISRITVDKITGEKTLFLECLYSFQKVPNQIWREGIDFVKQFAKTAECERISLYTQNRRMMELAKVMGLTERFRCFTINLGDIQ